MTLETEVVGISLRAVVPAFVVLEVAQAPFMQALRLLDEFLAIVGMDAPDVLRQCHAFLGQHVAIHVGGVILGNVIHHYVEITHVQGLDHHLVEFSGVAGHTFDVAADHPDKQAE